MPYEPRKPRAGLPFQKPAVLTWALSTVPCSWFQSFPNCDPPVLMELYSCPCLSCRGGYSTLDPPPFMSGGMEEVFFLPAVGICTWSWQSVCQRMASSVQSSPRWTLLFDFIIYTNTLGELKLSNLFILGFHVFPSLTFHFSSVGCLARSRGSRMVADRPGEESSCSVSSCSHTPVSSTVVAWVFLDTKSAALSVVVLRE